MAGRYGGLGNTSVSGVLGMWAPRAHEGLKIMHLICETHTLAPLGTLGAQTPTGVGSCGSWAAERDPRPQIALI